MRSPRHPAVAYLLLVRPMRALCVAAVISAACFVAATWCDTLRDDPRYTAKLDDDAWKHLIDEQIGRQAAGETRPEGRDISWPQYWTAWYQGIRDSSGLPSPTSEFKSKEDMIRYIKQRLKAHGLPTYE